MFQRLDKADTSQAHNFVILDEWNPRVVIEDDGTARDKGTPIQHLARISELRRSQGEPAFQVIACIDGRGFGVRRADTPKLLRAIQGKVFTLRTLEHLVKSTDLIRFQSTL